MKAYIYCTQAKPYLISMGKDTKGVEMFQIIFDKKDWSKDEKYLNGSIVAECDVKEAFFLKDFDGVKYAENPIMHEHETLGHRHCLTEKELASYGKGKTLYCYHLEHVKPIELHLSDLYEDEDCTKPLTKAPQSYRFAYRRHDCTDEEARMINKWSDQEGHECFQDVYGWYYVEKCLIFSDHPEYCAKILNGEKDLEVRKTRIKGVEYK